MRTAAWSPFESCGGSCTAVKRTEGRQLSSRELMGRSRPLAWSEAPGWREVSAEQFDHQCRDTLETDLMFPPFSGQLPNEMGVAVLDAIAKRS